VRIVCDVPFTVAVAVLMRLPVLLAVGVVPPLPYLPLPYPLPLLVGVVPSDPELLVLLPQAAKNMTSVATMRTVHQAGLETFEMEKLCCIMGSSLASMGTSNGTSLSIYRYIHVEVTEKIVFTSLAVEVR